MKAGFFYSDIKDLSLKQFNKAIEFVEKYNVENYHGLMDSFKVIRQCPRDSYPGMLSVIDQLKGEKVYYMHFYELGLGTIKRINGNKIHILDGYKLRRLDICRTQIYHPATLAYAKLIL